MSSPTLDRVLDAIFRVDDELGIKFISEAGSRWLGPNASEAPPQNFLGYVHPDDVPVLKEVCKNKPDYFTCDLRIVIADLPRWVQIRAYRLQAASQFVFCLIDITAWKQDDSAYRHAAEHDELTGLANRALFKKVVEEQVRHGDATFSVALLDLDGFKKVNDTFGHLIGDAVLIETAKRLTRILGPGDLLARLGGDEFVVFFKDKSASASQGVIKNILLSVARPYDTAPHNAYIGVSIGVAEFPGHGNDYTTLLKNADTAMYHSKNAGKNRVSIFTPENASVDFSIKAAIHAGIHEGEFYLEYQPQYGEHRELIGAEALMRWNSGTFGRVSPDKFIPIVEESGLMPFLGKWALRYACHQLKKFQKVMPDFVMSVNVSPVQFSADGFDQHVLEAINEAGVDPSHVVLEITESTLMHSQEKTERSLATLREMGIVFSIDDFGTGFSSLAYLTRLPVSSIKIDKAFVRAISSEKPSASTDKKLINAMINLAHSIDLSVVAEGVETEQQMAFLLDSGCNHFQGYLLGKPMSADAMLQVIEQQVQVSV